MTDVLLKELSNSDIDWLTEMGHQEEVAADTVLVERGKIPETLYIVIDGTLSFSVLQEAKNRLSHVSVPKSEKTEWEMTRIGSGEVVGETPLVGLYPPVGTIKTLEKSLLLSISRERLKVKLQQDLRFAAHFYRTIAILLAQRRRIAENLLVDNRLVSNQEEPLKKVLTFLGKLNDSDIHWMMSVGSKQKIAAGMALFSQGRPIDALYILLDGTAAASICRANISSLSRAFASKDSDTSSTKWEVARYSSGEIIGEMSFLENRDAYGTVKSLENCLILSLPRHQLVAKLQMDVGFAARFYHAIAAVIQEKWRNAIIRLTYGQETHRMSEMLDEDMEHQDEIDLDILENAALAGARFDWMLKRFRGG
ncbi:MAG: cyclic nucleotide-binding domain-containing protein [Chroococcidiopsidaceae cyanobacterium CP_BM_ER_R8_30]|nr:cyclic nucleotide-binding domain-containing protein [Chroococcidiopsidaceae cyanobacterium CP_BM_ER_R8_30]